MSNVVQFPRFTPYGPSQDQERRRLAKLFAGKSIEDMRALWDSEQDERGYLQGYPCEDVHSYLNMLGDGAYCAV